MILISLLSYYAPSKFCVLDEDVQGRYNLSKETVKTDRTILIKEGCAMLTNYHTHTYRCFHASADPDESYVKKAIEHGYAVLGFSDHTPWPYASGYISTNERMPMGELQNYVNSIGNLRETYGDQIQIFTGLECEYFPEYIPWLRTAAPKFDYLILGNHFGLTDEHGELYYARATTPELVEEYTRYTLLGMRTGLFSCLAHPELPLGSYPVFDRMATECAHAICREAEALDLPLEYNLYGVLKKQVGKLPGLGYPAPEFWEIAAQYKIRAIVGVDAHRPEHLENTHLIYKAREYLQSLGLTVMEKLDL